MSSADTIFALATARGKAGVAVVRLSGPRSGQALRHMSGADVPVARRMSLQVLRDLAGAVIDHALVVFFEKNQSFTGEESVELHLHGSPAIQKAVLQYLSGLDGLRLAEPGEFTRRALENNRMDLAQVEGLADLIEAETEAQRKQAQRVFDGALGAEVGIWRKDLIRAAALLEAVIDFADEDVPVDVTPEVLSLIDGTRPKIAAQVQGQQAAERIRDGFEVAIVGKPNVGKSTLLNRLAGREAALTSDIAGTTRDVIEVRMDLAGLAVTMLDTAGLRDSDDPIETAGVGLARVRATRADLRVFLLGQGDQPDPELFRTGDIAIQGKVDEGGDGVSGKTGYGLDALIFSVTQALEDRASGASLVIRERHRAAMDATLRDLDHVRDALIHAHGFEEVQAELLRRAVQSLDSVIGRVDVEDILDEIFASFCLGK